MRLREDDIAVVRLLERRLGLGGWKGQPGMCRVKPFDKLKANGASSRLTKAGQNANCSGATEIALVSTGIILRFHGSES